MLRSLIDRLWDALYWALDNLALLVPVLVGLVVGAVLVWFCTAGGGAAELLKPAPTPTPYPHGYQHTVCETTGYLPITCGKNCTWWMPIQHCYTVTEP